MFSLYLMQIKCCNIYVVTLIDSSTTASPIKVSPFFVFLEFPLCHRSWHGHYHLHYPRSLAQVELVFQIWERERGLIDWLIDLQVVWGMCLSSSGGRAPVCKCGDLGWNPGPDANFSLNIVMNIVVVTVTSYNEANGVDNDIVIIMWNVFICCRWRSSRVAPVGVGDNSIM